MLFKKITSSIVFSWIMTVLKLANVDLTVFKGHSTRSASTFKTNMQELVVSDILQRGSRTNNTQALSAEEKFKNALSLSKTKNYAF